MTIKPFSVLEIPLKKIRPGHPELPASIRGLWCDWADDARLTTTSPLGFLEPRGLAEQGLVSVTEFQEPCTQDDTQTGNDPKGSGSVTRYAVLAGMPVWRQFYQVEDKGQPFRVIHMPGENTAERLASFILRDIVLYSSSPEQKAQATVIWISIAQWLREEELESLPTSNRVIARYLDLSPNTVAKHKKEWGLKAQSDATDDSPPVDRILAEKVEN